MISFFSSTKTQKLTATILLLVLCAGFGASILPSSAYAEENSYYDGPSFDELFEKYAKQCATSAVIELVLMAVISVAVTQVPTVDWGDKIIKLIKNCLVNATKFALLELITGQTVGWSQKGYGGNPSFVQNIGQYLVGIADNVAGQYIEQTTAGEFLCSPFRAQLQIALTRHYQQQSGRSQFLPGYGSSCTLTGIAQNTEAFLGGDFYSGGWESWIEMSANPYNTPYGAYLKTTEELDRKIAEQTAEASKKLDFASGFLSKETQNCYETQETTEDGTVVTYQECDPPQTVTPGETVKSSLEKVFGTKLDTVVQADEINEIISLVAVYLLSDVLTKDEGLTNYNYTQEFEEPLVVVDDPNDYGGGGGGGGSCGTGPYVAPENSGEAGQRITFSESGVIVSETETGAENWVVRSAPADKKYSRIEATFNMKVGELVETEQSQQDYNGFFWVVRGSSGRLYGGGDHWDNNVVAEVGYLLADGKIRIMHNMDHPAYGVCGITGNAGAVIATGDTYTVTLIYETDPSNPGYGVSASFDGPGDHDFMVSAGDVAEFIDLDNIDGDNVISTGISLVFGPGTVSDGFQVPGGAGWEYSNLHVTVSP